MSSAGGVVYSATKAFGLNFAESLWAELSPKGVDVICAVCGAMNTPSLNKLLDERNLSVPGLLEPDDVIETLLQRFGDTPLHVFAFQGNDAQAHKVEDERRQRLALMEKMSKAFYGDVAH
jgi:short-subunit dehydrogenase